MSEKLFKDKQNDTVNSVNDHIEGREIGYHLGMMTKA